MWFLTTSASGIIHRLIFPEKMRRSYFLFPLLALVACSSGNEQRSAIDKATYLALGDSITAHAQQLLMANVAKAIAERGAAGAVDFCSEKAVFLTDSVSGLHGAAIQRLSDRNRNLANAIASDQDRSAWAAIVALMKDDAAMPKHLLKEGEDGVFYYKAIPLGMPTCLKCHGSKEEDIAPETLQAIEAKYPADKATGYKLGELRGMWKVKLD